MNKYHLHFIVCFQYFVTTLAPVWLRTIVGKRLNKGFRNEYLQKMKKTTEENDLETSAELKEG